MTISTSQVKVEDWDKRTVKSIKIESSANVTAINSTGTYELYILKDDLQTNPIADNAALLRKQARNHGNSLCAITFPTFHSDWINSVAIGIVPVDTSSACNVVICQRNECQAITNNKNETIEYHNCTRACDIVIGVNTEDKFTLFTVSYPDSDHKLPNNVTLIGLFDKPSALENTQSPAGQKSFFGIPINTPVYPTIVPRFRTLNDLAVRMGQVLSRITSINTTVSIKYSEGAIDEPGSLLFGIKFDAGVRTPPISLSPSLPLGDLASVKVQNASIALLGNMSVSNEFGIIFGPDDNSSLKLTGLRKNETICSKTAFNATIYFVKNNIKGNETISIIPACDIDGKLGSLIQAFAENAKLKRDVNVTSVGGFGEFALEFDPLYSYVQISVAKAAEPYLARFGMTNGDFDKKSPFQFASGLFEVIAGIQVKGGAEITAKVANVLEVSAEIDTTFFGQVRFSAGKQGQLIAFDDWLAKLIALKDTKSEDYDRGFASAVLTLDGNIAGEVSSNALGVSTRVTGSFTEPYNYNLFENATRPKFVLDVNLPNFGDLRNLSFRDVIKLLEQAMELLVGSAEADTVESCSGGLLGKEIFTTKIPVVDVSACDFAGVLQIVVVAVDTLVNECSGCSNSSETNSTSDDPTFQALEVKLGNLLQGMILVHLDFVFLLFLSRDKKYSDLATL